MLKKAMFGCNKGSIPSGLHKLYYIAPHHILVETPIKQPKASKKGILQKILSKVLTCSFKYLEQHYTISWFLGIGKVGSRGGQSSIKCWIQETKRHHHHPIGL